MRKLKKKHLDNPVWLDQNFAPSRNQRMKIVDKHSCLDRRFSDNSGLELAKICVQAGWDAKAEEIIVLDVRGLSSFTDYFVIMSGRSTRHVQGLAEAIAGEFRLHRINRKNTEGLSEGLWVLLDFDDIVVHIFYKDSRNFYDLEGLWHDAKKLPLNDLMAKDKYQASNMQPGPGNKL